MVAALLTRIFGSRNQRVIRRLQSKVQAINHLEAQFHDLTDAELRARTDLFRARLQAGETLDALLPEAFAAVREASMRTLKLRHFDVQLIGGMVLHEGKIAEMRTGEGKTLMASLPAYLNALTGKGVHIITVNDYLAKRDAEWMSPIFTLLGLRVGVVVHGMSNDEKRKAYSADIVYGTNNEFGFDYMRDNMAFSFADKVQRDLHFAVVDEVDSILIDEARTPLIISGPAEDSSEMYANINKLIPALQKRETETGPGDYYLDEKSKQAYLTEAGHQKVEELLVEAKLLKSGDTLYSPANIILMHHVNAALRANKLFHRDVDYIVKDNQVIIVDEHTGRLMPGRRWSDGLHQAIEAKENTHIQTENQTLASITFQNYFRLYHKLAGMTGTADTEAYEFQQIYNLEVVVIPTNKPMRRVDLPDIVYLRQKDKFKAVIEDIKDCVQRGQPVLVGTASIETSELLSQQLKQEKIAHQVLNAKFHEQEANIIAEAGRPGAVTIATNMAGRGTDIVLGGKLEAELDKLSNATEAELQKVKAAWQSRHDAVIAAGGLRIIGSERHESRRIDNQLRGRAGRQGDPGSTRFYIALEDNLIRIFASDRMAGIMQTFGMQEDMFLESKMLSGVIEKAQRKVESFHFDIRKQLLEYDDVANEQRKAIYAERNALLANQDVSDAALQVREDVLTQIVEQHIPHHSLEEEWNVSALTQQLQSDFGLDLPIQQWLQNDPELTTNDVAARVVKAAQTMYAEKEAQSGAEVMRHFEKSVMLQSLDMLWREHLAAMDHMRQGIGLRSYAQKNPKQEYKREAFNLFATMLERFKYDVASILCKVQIQAADDVEEIDKQRRHALEGEMQFEHDTLKNPLQNESYDEPQVLSRTIVNEQPKVGRNDPCPCGSQKKFKHCHGRLD